MCAANMIGTRARGIITSSTDKLINMDTYQDFS